jgi:hypothetical protein
MKIIKDKLFAYKTPTCALVNVKDAKITFSLSAFFHQWWSTLPRTVWHNQHLIDLVRHRLYERPAR